MIEYFVLLLVTVGLIYTLITFLLTHAQIKSKKGQKSLKYRFSGISILKPIKGVDDQLETNLHSFFQINYPEYELLFGINDPQDPAIKIVKKLLKIYPDVPAKLIISSNHVGLNPKVNNLYNIFPQAQYDNILISDSNVRVPGNYLKSMIFKLSEPGTGLVTSVFRGTGANSLGAILENLHLNTFVSGNVIAVGKLFNHPITIGKSMLFKRDVVNQLAGFSSLANVLAEDHLLGLHIQHLGLRAVTSDVIIDNYNENWRFDRFINRHIRWAKMRKNLNLYHYLLELIINPVFVAMIYALAAAALSGWLIFVLTVMIKMTIDISTARSFKSGFHMYEYLLLPVKDILLGLIWMVPFVNNKIIWRGNTFRIGKGTKIFPYHKGTPA